MKAMNFESTKWRREAIDDIVVDEETLAAPSPPNSSRRGRSDVWPWGTYVPERRRREGGARRATGRTIRRHRGVRAQDVPRMISATARSRQERQPRGTRRRSSRSRPLDRTVGARPDTAVSTPCQTRKRRSTPNRGNRETRGLAQNRSSAPTAVSGASSAADIDRKRARAKRGTRVRVAERNSREPRQHGVSTYGRDRGPRSRVSSKPARWRRLVRRLFRMTPAELELRAA